jgi:hypothetical protein
MDLRASAALGNVPPAVARVLAHPGEPEVHLAFAAELRELGARERAALVERFVERNFGPPPARSPSGAFPPREVRSAI